MRLRNVRGSREMIQTNPYVIQEPETYKGRWKDYFRNNGSIHIEIGMGKGQFIKKLASIHPEINYIGIEKYSSVLIRAIEKQEESQLSNLVFIRMDAENINDVFGQNEVDNVYLNFSDPWPKDRHAKRRLTSQTFFERYDKLLVKDGQVIFKTDNRPLFDFSLEQVKEVGWKLQDVTFDLHHSQYVQGNVMTEYEEKYAAQGNPICRLIAYR